MGNFYASSYNDQMRYLREMQIAQMQVSSGWYTERFDPVPIIRKDICSHKPIPPKLITYLTQLIEYYRQVYPEHKFPAEEGAAVCLKCAVHHYKKLKTI